MMHDIYDYLSKFAFRNPEQTRVVLSKFTEKRLAAFLEGYIELAQKRKPAKKGFAGSTDIYPDSWIDPVPLEMVKRLSLYANRIYVHDELLKIALDYPSLDALSYLIRNESRLKRVLRYENYLGGVIKEMLEIKDLVLSGIVYLSPTELTSSESEIQRTVNGTSASGMTGGNKQPLTPSLEDYFQSHTKVHPATISQGEPRVHESLLLTPSSNIAVTIEGDDKDYLFNVMQSFVADKIESTHGIKMFSDPETDPLQESSIDFEKINFWGWVAQKKEGVFRQKLERLMMDVARAKANRARFVTSSPVTTDILALSGYDVTQEKTLNGVLNIELPYFDNVPFKAIVKARKDEGAYEEFKSALDKAIASIDAEVGSPLFQQRLDEISRDVVRLPMLKIDKQMRGLKEKVFVGGLPGVGTLALNILSPSAALSFGSVALAVGGAMTGLYLSTKPDQNKAQDMPAYFYWKATSKSRKRTSD